MLLVYIGKCDTNSMHFLGFHQLSNKFYTMEIINPRLSCFSFWAKQKNQAFKISASCRLLLRSSSRIECKLLWDSTQRVYGPAIVKYECFRMPVVFNVPELEVNVPILVTGMVF